MAAVSIYSDFGAQKVKSATVSTVSPSICHEVMGPDGMILVVVNSITPIATSVFFKIFKKTQKFYKKSVIQLQKYQFFSAQPSQSNSHIHT